MNFSDNKLIIANWKMFGNFEFTKDYFHKISDKYFDNRIRVIVCPPYPYINYGYMLLSQHNNEQVCMGAQDVSSLIKEASTGEINYQMLEEIGAKIALVGHSERRQLFETDEIVNEKIKNLQNSSITAVLCIGETEEINSKGETNQFLSQQIKNALININEIETFFVAYEPVWAIGNNKTPSLDDIEKISSFIRKEVNNICKIDNLKVLYGGSVKQNNMNDIIKLDGVDGVLVGSFSLKTDDFFKTIENLVF